MDAFDVTNDVDPRQAAHFAADSILISLESSDYTQAQVDVLAEAVLILQQEART